MKRILFLLFFAGQSSGTQLQKVFHHMLEPQALEQDKMMLNHIELAKLVFYFSHEPQIRTKDENSKTAQAKQIFFFPGASLDAQVTEAIANVHKNKNPYYCFTIKEVSKPSKGIELSVYYNPQKVMVKYDTFDAITGAKGVEFHVYNKQLLTELQNKNSNVLRTACIHKPLIVIDAGHGGSDMGTIGKQGLAEKNVTLALSKQLENELKKNGYQVCMTRIDDSFIALDQRTKIANEKDNALFISLHANNAKDPQVQGVETFCLDSNLFKSVHNELATAIDVMIQSADEQKNTQSKKLADAVHTQILRELKTQGYPLADRKVKHAATQVLMGIKWPGVLIEVDFLSNLESEKRLNEQKFREIYVQGICKGIEKYCSL